MTLASDNMKHVKTARFWMEKLIPVMREDLTEAKHRDEALRILSEMSHELLLSDGSRFDNGAG